MTINSVNANYNLTQEIQKNSAQSTKEIPTPTQNSATTQDLAKDKSQAVKEVLGYGVDSEGFFTSDLNEAAGIPKDYRIEAKLFEIADSLFTTQSLYGKATHLSTNWAKTLGDFYQNSFKGLISNEVFGESLSEKQYREIFKDTKSWEEILKLSNNMASNKGFALTKKFFESDWSHSIKGETNTNGKINGVDSNISKGEYKSFRNFMDANQFDDPTLPDSLNQHNLANGWSVSSSKMTLAFQAQHLSQMDNKDEELKDLSKMINDIKSDYFELLDKDDLSLEEFKTEYMKIKERHDEFVKQYKAKMKATSTSETNDDGKSQKPFTPIQVTSKSETYKGLDSLSALEFIKSQQKLEQILMLFQRESKGKFDIKGIENFIRANRGLDREV